MQYLTDFRKSKIKEYFFPPTQDVELESIICEESRSSDQNSRQETNIYSPTISTPDFPYTESRLSDENSRQDTNGNAPTFSPPTKDDDQLQEIIIDPKSKLSDQNSRQDTNIYAPTFSTPDFPNSGSRGQRNNVLLLNSSESKSQETSTPNEILSEEQIKSYEHFKSNGFDKDVLTEHAKKILGNNFKGWKNRNEIRRRLPFGCYLISIIGKSINHCTALYVLKEDLYEYFDSFGIPLHKIIGVRVISNEIQFQDTAFKTCGLHAIYFHRERIIEVHQTKGDMLEYIEEGRGEGQRYNLTVGMKKVQESYPTQKKEFLFKNDHHVINEIYRM